MTNLDVDTEREPLGSDFKTDQQLQETVSAAHDAFLHARDDLESVIIEVVATRLDSEAPKGIEEIRRQVIEAYRSLSGQNYFPHQVITRPSKKTSSEDI